MIDVVLADWECDHCSKLKTWAKHFKVKLGLRLRLLLLLLSLLCRHIECERNLMAKRPAPLNMNKPSSAEIRAKPNSARRHHCRTGQEALQLFLASTAKIQHLPLSPSPLTPIPKVNCPSKKKKDNCFKTPCGDCCFFLLLIFSYRHGDTDSCRIRRRRSCRSDRKGKEMLECAAGFQLRLWRWLKVRSLW